MVTVIVAPAEVRMLQHDGRLPGERRRQQLRLHYIFMLRSSMLLIGYRPRQIEQTVPPACALPITHRRLRYHLRTVSQCRSVICMEVSDS